MQTKIQPGPYLATHAEQSNVTKCYFSITHPQTYTVSQPVNSSFPPFTFFHLLVHEGAWDR